MRAAERKARNVNDGSSWPVRRASAPWPMTLLTVFAVLGGLVAVLMLLALTLNATTTGEVDWPILTAGLLILPSAAAAWRLGKRRDGPAA